MSTKKKIPRRRELAKPKGTPSDTPAATGKYAPSWLDKLDPARKKQLARYGTGAGAVLVGLGVALPYFAPTTAASVGNGGLWALKIVGILLVFAAWAIESVGKKKRG